MNNKDVITDYIVKEYLTIYGLEYQGTTEELFLLFNIEDFHQFHARMLDHLMRNLAPND